MPMIIVKVKGLNELIKKTEEQMKAETWAHMMHTAIIEAKRFAKELCPVDKGDLRKSIHIRKISDNEYSLTADCPYASFNEWGTYCIPSGTGEVPVFYKGGMRPFIRPALWIMNKDMKKYISKIIFKGHFY